MAFAGLPGLTQPDKDAYILSTRAYCREGRRNHHHHNMSLTPIDGLVISPWVLCDERQVEPEVFGS